MTAPFERISHYRITARLGKGAMGEVYRAVDERLGRAVALKLLPKARAESADMQARLLREAQAASALNHPGIVTVHDVGAWHGRVFMVMELVEGERLSDLARSGVAVEEALRLVADAADALGAAHARDILHRDIKSDNLMRTVDGRVKVLDFGLAKLRTPSDKPGGEPTTSPFFKMTPGEALAATLGASASAAEAEPAPAEALGETAPATDPRALSPSALAQALESADASIHSQPAPALTPSSTLTLAGQLVGTPAYMAPEQTNGGSGDAISEVFSLGVVLFELLCGRRPFDRDSIAATLEAVRTAPLLPPSLYAPERKIPPAVDAIVLRAIDRDRQKRYRSMAELASALRQARADLLPPDPRARRRRLLATAAAIASVGLAGGAVALVATRPTRVSATVTSTRHLTFDPGCEEYPSFTPDGRVLVYDGLADGDYEVLALELSTGKKTRLTHSPGWDYAPALSPDGKKVAFLHTTDAGRELRVMPLAGDVTPPTSLGLVTTVPSWMDRGALVVSPSGDSLWRYELTPERRSLIASLPQSSLVRYVSAFDNGEVVALWQPTRQALDYTLGLVTTDGAREIESALPLDQSGLAVAPSQEGFYYSRHGGSANEILRRSRDGGPPVVVPGGISASSGFSISADGKRLAYSTCRESNYVARLRQGQPVVELLPRGNWRDREVVPVDERHYVYASDRAGQNQVWLLDLERNEQRPLTGPNTAMPSLSHDKKLLVYADRSAGIFVMPLAGGAPTRITSEPTDSQPQFTYDDNWIVFQRVSATDGSRIWVVPATGGEPKAITPPGSQAPAVSPVRDQIIYLQPVEKGALVMFTDVRGGRPELAFKYLAPGDFENPRLSPDGKRLLLVRKMTDVIELSLDEINPQPKLLWKGGIEGVSEVDYAPDGDGLIAAMATWDGDLWLADGDFR